MLKTTQEYELSDINVTPFIDIMLVLLIIFMVVTPLMTSSVKIELPKVSENMIKDELKPVILSIEGDGNLSINDEVVDEINLSTILAKKTAGNFEEVIYFYVDKSVSYDILIQIMSKIKELGYAKIALSAEVKNDKK